MLDHPISRIRQIKRFVSSFWPAGWWGMLIVLGLSWWQIQVTKTETVVYQSSGIELNSVTPAMPLVWPKHNLLLPPETAGRSVLIKFEYRCQPQCGPLWVGYLQADGSSWTRVLMSHPVVNQLNWLHNFSQGWFLYQKHLQYPDLASFGRRLPQGTWLVDSQLLELNPNLPAVSLDTRIQIDEAEYVVTSWQPPRLVNGWYQFRRRFQVSNAAVDEQGRVRWQIVSRPDFPRFSIWMRRFDITY